MTETARIRAREPIRWPMTDDAHDLLRREVAQLRAEVAAPAGNGIEEGVLLLPVARATQRLETLSTVLADAETVGPDRRAAIGRRVTFREPDGVESAVRLVFPGDGDPMRGWISADSPLGAALLGARAKEAVAVRAPAGTWTAVVVEVE